MITVATLIGSYEDFDSTTFYITFTAREINKTVNVPVMCDQIVENTERFDISLSLINKHQVRIGRSRSVGIILDNTGK